MSARVLRPSWMALLALAAAAAVAGAQSLGELAAKEQQRREKERQKRGGASKVITESDLGGTGRGTFSNAGSTAAPSPESSASPSPAAAEGAAAKKEKTPDEIRAEEQNAWSQRLTAARKEATDLSDRVNSLQQRLNDLTGPIYGSSRTAVLSEFEAAKAQLAAANQKVADLEEEGRRKSYR